MNPLNFSSSSPYETLISQIIRIESQPQLRLEDQRSERKDFKKVLGNFDSKLSTLHTQLETLTDPFSNPFGDKSASVPEGAGYTISAADGAALGSHSLQVDRLAKTDARVSQKYDSAGTTLDSWFHGKNGNTGNGAQTFSISVAHPTDAAPDNRVNIDVTVDPVGTTEEEILKEIGTAINQAMTDAVDAGTITKEEKVNASVLNETTGTARLSIRSGKTGYANRVGFTDSADGLLTELQVNANQLATDTGGGQITAVGTDETSQLNSKFVLDGLTHYRSSNKVTDALEGLTIELQEALGTQAEFTVEADSESVKEQIDAFIKKYNAVLQFIQQKTHVDGDAQIRGAFAGERTFTSLRYKMRNDVSQKVSGQPAGAPAYLRDLGIDIAEDGTLELADENALLEAVEKDAGAVESLFSSTDGVATRLLAQLNRFLGTGGLLNNRENNIDSAIRRLDKRITAWDDRLAQRENQLRDQFAQLQESMAAFQGQQQYLGSFLQSPSFF